MDSEDIPQEIAHYINQSYIVPPQYLGDVLQIRNFFINYSDFIDCPYFTIEQLYSQLNYDGDKYQVNLLIKMTLEIQKILIIEQEDNKNKLSIQLPILELIHFYYSFSRYYLKKKDRKDNYFDKELLLNWRQLFYDYIYQTQDLEEKQRNESLDALQSLDELDCFQEKYKKLLINQKICIFKYMIDCIMKFKVIQNWDEKIRQRLQEQQDQNNEKLTEKLKEKQKQFTIMQDQLKKKKFTDEEHKLQLQQLSDDTIDQLNNQISELKYCNENLTNQFVNQYFIGEINQFMFHFSYYDKHKIFVQFLKNQKQYFYIIDSNKNLINLKSYLKNNKMNSINNQQILNNINQLEISKSLNLINNDIDTFQDEYFQRINYQLGDLKFYKQIDIQKLICVKIRKIDKFFTKYLQFKSCRWETKSQRESLMEELLQKFNNFETFNDLVRNIYRKLSSVQYLCEYDGQSYQQHKEQMRQPINVKTYQDFQKLENQLDIQLSQNDLYQEEVTLRKLSLSLLGRHYNDKNVQSVVNSFLKYNQSITYLNTFVHFLFVCTRSYVNYYFENTTIECQKYYTCRLIDKKEVNFDYEMNKEYQSDSKEEELDLSDFNFKKNSNGSSYKKKIQVNDQNDQNSNNRITRSRKLILQEDEYI